MKSMLLGMGMLLAIVVAFGIGLFGNAPALVMMSFCGSYPVVAFASISTWKWFTGNWEYKGRQRQAAAPAPREQRPRSMMS